MQNDHKLKEENLELKRVVIKLNRKWLRKDNQIRNLKKQNYKLKKQIKWLKKKS